MVINNNFNSDSSGSCSVNNKFNNNNHLYNNRDSEFNKNKFRNDNFDGFCYESKNSRLVNDNAHDSRSSSGRQQFNLSPCKRKLNGFEKNNFINYLFYQNEFLMLQNKRLLFDLNILKNQQNLLNDFLLNSNKISKIYHCDLCKNDFEFNNLKDYHNQSLLDEIYGNKLRKNFNYLVDNKLFVDYNNDNDLKSFWLPEQVSNSRILPRSVMNFNKENLNYTDINNDSNNATILSSGGNLNNNNFRNSLNEEHILNNFSRTVENFEEELNRDKFSSLLKIFFKLFLSLLMFFGVLLLFFFVLYFNVSVFHNFVDKLFDRLFI